MDSSKLDIENDSSSESGDDTNDDEEQYSKFRPKLLKRGEDELEFEDEEDVGQAAAQLSGAAKFV